VRHFVSVLRRFVFDPIAADASMSPCAASARSYLAGSRRQQRSTGSQQAMPTVHAPPWLASDPISCRFVSRDPVWLSP